MIRKHPGYVFRTLPNGQGVRIPVERSDDIPFDLDEAKLFEETLTRDGEHGLLYMLHDLRKDGLSYQQATGVVLEYMDTWDQIKGK